MRGLLLERLERVPHHEFLVYLMGPYRSFTADDLVTEAEHEKDESASFNGWIGGEGTYTERDVLELLERIRDRLRIEAGLNAFLAIDADIPLEEMDAATQSIEFAKASNAIAFVAPAVGKNLGVGIEAGSVLEGLPAEDHERMVFVHEEAVQSAMIASISQRWNATVYSFYGEDELVKRIREFAVDVMNREANGDLPPRKEK